MSGAGKVVGPLLGLATRNTRNTKSLEVNEPLMNADLCAGLFALISVD